MKALVTGANGFVGAHLVRELLREGWQVRAMMRRSSDASRLAGLAPEVVYADLLDAPSLLPAVQGSEVVFHVAGAIATLDADGFDRVNRSGTENLRRAVEDALSTGTALRHLVQVSSLAAAGPSGGDGPVQDGAPEHPVSRYGRSKLAAERALAGLRGVALTIVRPPPVYGSGDTATLDLFRSVQRRLILAQTGPERRMSFVHAADLARGLRLAAATPPADETRVLYLTGPEETSLAGFQRLIARRMGVRALEVPVPELLMRAAGHAADLVQRWTRQPRAFGSDKVAEGLARGWLVSNEKARGEIGYEPRVSLAEGIDEALTWYREHGWL